ncbi:FMN-linked oxidoreductase [Dentipellis sp. KUC8613]|nr:FMN-linked oxidoreductase [Dentipellis sp. KUC8613]
MATLPDLSRVAAPMVNQSDLPFRLLVRKHNASLTYTQMLDPERVLSSQDYLEFHQRGLGEGTDRPVVVQLCGNDQKLVVEAARKFQGYCDGIDLNLGCPQEAARDGHYGAYLLGQKDWPLNEAMISALSHSVTVPVSAKLRLCQPATKTLELAQRLECAGASWITLHARTVSARRRRQGAADLTYVRTLKEGLRIPVLSNGNVRTWEDVEANLDFTGADGVMVGETLLGNPCLFENKLPDPVRISLEYLDIYREHPDTASLQTIQTHVRHFVEFQCGRRPWFHKFRSTLSQCKDVDEIDNLLRGRVQRWRGAIAASLDNDTDTDMEDGRGCQSADREEAAMDITGLDLPVLS